MGVLTAGTIWAASCPHEALAKPALPKVWWCLEILNAVSKLAVRLVFANTRQKELAELG